jgi:hypothetical protein
MGVRCPLAGILLTVCHLFVPTGMEDRAASMEEADTILTKAMGRYNNSAVFLILNAVKCRRSGALEDCVSYSRQAVEALPQSGLCCFFHGSTHFVSLDFPSAEAAYRRAYELGIDLPGTTQYTIAQCQVMQGDLEACMESISRVAEVANPKNKSDQYAVLYTKHLLARPEELPLAPLYGIYRRCARPPAVCARAPPFSHSVASDGMMQMPCHCLHQQLLAAGGTTCPTHKTNCWNFRRR